MHAASGPATEGVWSTLPMGTASLDGRILHANAAMCRLLGTSAEELAGRSLGELAGDEAVTERASRDVAQALQEGLPGGELRSRVVAGDGTLVQVRVHWSLVPEEQGAPAHVVAVLVDESERLAAEAARTASEARWRTLLLHAADVLLTCRSDAAITWATPSLTRTLGYELSTLGDRSLLDLVHADEQSHVRDVWRTVATGEREQEAVECRVARAGGGWSWARLTVTDLREDPHVGALVVHLLDTTEQRESERRRADQDARFRVRFEGSSVAQTTVDASGRLSEVNDAACRMLGRDRAVLVGQPLRALTHPQDSGQADQVLRAMLQGSLAATQVERVMARPDGSPVHVLVDVAVLHDGQGRPTGAAAFLHDLSALRSAEQRRQQQEDLFLALSRRASDLALVSDRDGRILYATAAVSHVFGYEAKDVVGGSGWDFVHPDDLAAARAAFDGVVRDGGTTAFLLRVRAADGQWRWVEETVTNLLDQPLAGVVANLRDVTERVEAETALRASEARYRAIADTAEEGIWLVTPQGRTVYANARLASILGRSLDEVYSHPAHELFGAHEAEAVRTRLAERAQRGTERYEQPYSHPDGVERLLWVAASPLRDADGRVEGSLGMVSDITDARRLAAELEHAALHDTLTGLPNRALLEDRLEQALTRRTDSTAVLFLDLDHFGLVNESRGHAVGDALLIAVSRRLLAAVRPVDTVARFGGDEFVVVCEDVDEQGACALAEHVLAALSPPFDVDGEVLHVGASIGVACAPAPGAADLLRYADAALHSAKLEGRGRVRPFDLTITEQAEQRQALGAELREALPRDELTVHYQPVVDLATGAVLGMEALTRWTSPARGAVRPDVFVAVAELTGLAPDLDRWVVRRALGDAARLRSSGAVPPSAYVAINLSPHSLDDPGLEPLLLAETEGALLRPCDVVLEITEGAIMQDTHAAIAVLRRLRDHGFAVAIDDFGTGYSSLAYLRDLPVTALKIDRSFVTGIATDRDALAIVASIVDLARAVGIGTVAEGVETQEQADLLRRLGCTTAQGWLWSRAVPPEEITAARAWPQGLAPAAAPPTGGPGRASASRPLLPEHGLPRLLELHRAGASLATVAAALNAEGYRTPTGTRWHRTSVARAVAGVAYPSLED